MEFGKDHQEGSTENCEPYEETQQSLDQEIALTDTLTLPDPRPVEVDEQMEIWRLATKDQKVQIIKGARLVADRYHLLAAVVDRQRRLEAAVRAAGDGVRESVACPRCGQVGHRFYRLTSLSLLSWIPERDGDVCDFDFSIYA
ncbi:hypothetical protein QAD02_022614 [Eretmocerus hayati]|uniref:Uncharacterized protein n=1 Tax=Eretmocerus hayati TaxID=131215 RepID=A0ACC2PYE7_9HYME|nr:hypothetical protein QAD02_022614 [Eretmocerus hayati]